MFSLLLPLVQALSIPLVEGPSTSLVILEAMASAAVVFLLYFALKLELHYLIILLTSSHLLSLQFLFKFITLSYHCSMKLGWHSDSISLCHIVLFMLLLNSSTKCCPSYLLPLAILLNSCTNSFIVFPPCSNHFNSATFTASVRVKDNKLYLFQFSSYSYLSFPLLSILGDLGLGFCIILQSHDMSLIVHNTVIVTWSQ